MAESTSRNFCCVSGCSSSTQKQPYLSFHLFPVDPNLKPRWIQAIRREEGNQFTIKRGSTYVCSRHFANEDFIGGCVAWRAMMSQVYSLGTILLLLWEGSQYDRTIQRQSVQLRRQDGDIVAKAARMDHDYVTHPPAGKTVHNVFNRQRVASYVYR